MKFLRFAFLGLLSTSLSIVLSAIITFYGHFFQVKSAVEESLVSDSEKYFVWEFISSQDSNWSVYFWIMIAVFSITFFCLLSKFKK